MAIGLIGGAAASLPQRPIIESIVAERQRVLSLAVMCCLVGLLLHAAFLHVMPASERWEAPLTLACAAVVLLVGWLNYRSSDFLNVYSLLVVLAGVIAMLGRIVAVHLGDFLQSEERSVHLGVYFYLPIVFVGSVLMFSRPWSTVVNTVVWLLVAVLATGMLLWKIGWAPQRQGFLTLLALLWFGYPVFVVLLLQIERYLGHMQVLQMRARLGDDYLLQARDAERARVEIGRANRLLARQNEDVEQFSAALSHDLKSPVQLMVMNAQTLLIAEADRSEEEQAALREIVTNGAQCHRLMDALVQFVRVGRQPPKRELLTMNTVVDDLIHGYQAALQSQQGSLQRDGELNDLFGDAVLLTELFRNLIDNGFKYNESGNKQVTVRQASAGDGFTVIAVEDNGIGMPPDRARDAGMLFGRLPGAERYGEGSGVGLAFVQKIVSLHGGWLQFEAREQGGTRALIGLPAAERGSQNQ